MSIEEGFLNDICANPDDVAPRLVYADWLDDRGNKGDAERAEFIRLQCRPDGSAQREKELLDQWGKGWYKPFKGRFARYEFRRGFIERVTMKAKTFLDEGESLLARTPLRHVKLRDPKDHVAALTTCKTVARLDGLNLNYGNLGGQRMAELLKSKHLGNLRWLDLGNNNIGLTGVESLVKAVGRLKSLRFLALDDNRLGYAGINLLTRSPFLGQLQALNLDGNDINDYGLDQLASKPAARGLVQLHLTRNGDLTRAALVRLVNSPHLAALRKVYLSSTAPYDDVVQLKQGFAHRLDLDNEDWDAKLEDGPAGRS